MRTTIVICIVLIIAFGKLQAQKPDSVRTLSEVTIRDHAIPANKLQLTVDSLLEPIYTSSTLSSWMLRNSANHIRQYASGTLSTINSLGFGSTQNTITWNGLILNNAMNGTQDLNLLPIWFVRMTSVASNSNYINTGSIHQLVSEVGPENKFSAYTTITTTHNISNGIKANVAFSKHRFAIAGIYSNQQNKIPYFNQLENEKSILTHAKAKMYGGQALYQLTISKKINLESAIWYVTADRKIPPSMLQLISRAVEYDKQLRASIKCSWVKNAHQLIFSSAIAEDIILYNDSVISLYANNHFHLIQNQVQWIHNPSQRFNQSVLVRYQYNVARTDNYEGIKSQQRNFLQYTSQYMLKSYKGVIGFSAATDYVSERLHPWSASTYGHFKVAGHLYAKIEFARLYRIPTLNDLYWIPGGNASLQPEYSYKYQTAIRYATYRRHAIESETRCFYNQIENIIIWRPTGAYWSPVNLRNAVSAGITQSIQIALQFRNIKLVQECSYTFNKTKITATKDANDISLHKPIPYAPPHRLYATTIANLHAFRLIIQQEYCSARFFLFDEAAILKAYYTADLECRKSFGFNLHQIDVGLKVQNILNAAYQTIAWQPMPGRFFSFNILYSLTKNKLTSS